MSDSDSDYAHTEYQQTKYDSSEDELDDGLETTTTNEEGGDNPLDEKRGGQSQGAGASTAEIIDKEPTNAATEKEAGPSEGSPGSIQHRKDSPAEEDVKQADGLDGSIHPVLGASTLKLLQEKWVKWKQSHGRMEADFEDLSIMDACPRKGEASQPDAARPKMDRSMMIEQKYGAAARSAAMFKHYQPMLTQLIQSMTKEEIARVQSMADEWNTQGASPEAQVRFAAQGAQKAMRTFTEDMWKRGGIQMVILSGFKDEKGEIFSQVHDFNPAIASNPSFNSVKQ
ncbi:hypothetical protein OG21DRAFT_1528154, partial [Imleria badia]